MEIDITNAGPETETLHVLPTAWFRNTWSWEAGEDKPTMSADGADLAIDHPWLGSLEMEAGPGPDGAPPQLLFCENETNVERLFGATPLTAYPKDGINDYVIHGAASVNPAQTGTKAAFWYRVAVPAGETVRLKLRLRPTTAESSSSERLGTDFDTVMSGRRSEADEFYHELAGVTCGDAEAVVMRQAFAGLLWSKQFYFYDVSRWLDGDPLQPPPPEPRPAVVTHVGGT